MLRRGAQVALRRVGALPWAVRIPPASARTPAIATALHAPRLYSDSLYVGPEPGEGQETSQSARKPPIRKEAFGFDLEKESFIKPMWVEQEGAGQIVWRAKVIQELINSFKKDSQARYKVIVNGVSGLQEEPWELLSQIGQFALGLDKRGIRELTSYVTRGDQNTLLVQFSTQEAKLKFLDATPTIEKIRNSYNEGRHLSVEMTEFSREKFNLSVPLSMFYSMQHAFPGDERDPDPSLDGVDAAKEWVRHVETEIANYNKAILNNYLILDVHGFTAPYEALNKMDMVRLAEEIVESLNPGDRFFKKDISDVTIGRRHWGLPSDKFSNCLFLTFRRKWVAKILRTAASKAGEIPDPLNQGENLRYIPLESVMPRNLDHDLDTNSLADLAKRLNLVEATVIRAMNDYYQGSYMYYGRQEELQRLFEARSFTQANEFARRVLREEFGLGGNLARRISLEAGVLAPGTTGYLLPSKFSLQIQLFKGWEARLLSGNGKRIISRGNMGGFTSIVNKLMKLNARAVRSFLEERGTPATVFFHNAFPYILTENADGTSTPTLYTRFGLTQEEFSRHADPKVRWGPQEAGGVGVGTD